MYMVQKSKLYKKRNTQKRLPSIFFVSFFSFLQKLANSYNVYTWIHPALFLQMVHVMHCLLYLSFLLNSMSRRSLYLILYSGFSRESAHVCEGWQVPRSPGWVDMPDLGEPNQWYNSNSKATRLEIQEELLFQFESEGKKNSVFQPKGSLARRISYSGEGQCFFFIQTF